MKEILDIPYRQIGGTTLYLDLFLPDNAENPPLIFWIHGGAWMTGDRKWCGLKEQTGRGFAVASVDYRLTSAAPFPACIVDCKYALAFLRKNADKYPVNFSRVCAAGDSAGGHLAALMGVSAGHTDWEPEGADCSVQAVIDFYGPTSLKRNKNEPAPDSVVDDLLGTSVLSAKGKMIAAMANPINYVNGSEPPFLIIHGDKDDVVYIEHSYLLRNELEKFGIDVVMYTILGGGHDMSNPAIESVVNNFLDYHFNIKR